MLFPLLPGFLSSQPVVMKTQLSEMKQKDVLSVLRNKDLRKMVLEKTQEKKRRDCELALELLKEKEMQEDI